jgi:hypothetical protein
VPSSYSSLNSPGFRILSRFVNLLSPFMVARSLVHDYCTLTLYRPFLLLLLITYRPALVFILARNPCVRRRLSRDG